MSTLVTVTINWSSVGLGWLKCEGATVHLNQFAQSMSIALFFTMKNDGQMSTPMNKKGKFIEHTAKNYADMKTTALRGLMR